VVLVSGRGLGGLDSGFKRSGRSGDMCLREGGIEEWGGIWCDMAVQT